MQQSIERHLVKLIVGKQKLKGEAVKHETKKSFERFPGVVNLL